MHDFTPLPALVGGLLIGLASALLWLGNGRIAGISGLVANVLPRGGRLDLWRAIFLVCLVAGTSLAATLLPGLSGNHPLALIPPPRSLSVPTPLWIAGSGLLIGVGTRLANGCTSGHGVCGLARLSPRSLAAVATFFAVAIATVAITRIGA